MLIDDVWISAAMAAELEALTGAHRTTVARWLRDRRLPPAVMQLLRILKHGNLGVIAGAWDGWTLDPRCGLIYPPGEWRRGLSPGNLQALPWRLHQLAVLKAEIRAIGRYGGARRARDRAGEGSA